MIDTATVVAEPGPGALGHGSRDLGRHGAVRGEELGWDAELVTLHVVGVRDEPAEEVRAGAGDLGDRVRHQPPGARFGGRDGQTAVDADRVQALGQGDEAIVGHRLLSADWSSAVRPEARRATFPGSPTCPSAPSFVPLSVNSVTPDEPVRTSIDLLPWNVRVLPFL